MVGTWLRDLPREDIEQSSVEAAIPLGHTDSTLKQPRAKWRHLPSVGTWLRDLPRDVEHSSVEAAIPLEHTDSTLKQPRAEWRHLPSAGTWLHNAPVRSLRSDAKDI